MSDEQDKLKLSLEPPRFGRKKKATAKPAKPAAKARPASKRTSKKPEPTQPEPIQERVEDEPTDEVATETVEEREAPAIDEEVVDEEPRAEDPQAEEPRAEEPSPDEPPVEQPAAAGESLDEPVATAVPDTEPSESHPSETAGTVEEADTAVEGTAADTEPPAESTLAEAPDEVPESTPDDVPESPAETNETDEEAPAPSVLARWAKRSPFRRKPGTAPTATEPSGAEIDTADDTADDTGDDAAFDPAREDAEIVAMASEEPAGPREPKLALYPAGALTGLVVGASMVLLTWLSLRGCEAVRGTSSCGGGPGFVLLVATFVLCVLLGRALLNAFDAPDPGSSSFLAVGLVAAIALFFLIDFLDDWPMIVVIPLLSVGGFLASVWVTKTFVEEPAGE